MQGRRAIRLRGVGISALLQESLQGFEVATLRGIRDKLATLCVGSSRSQRRIEHDGSARRRLDIRDVAAR